MQSDSLVAELKDETGKVVAVFKFDNHDEIEAFGVAMQNPTKQTFFKVTCLRLFVGNAVVAVKGDL